MVISRQQGMENPLNDLYLAPVFKYEVTDYCLISCLDISGFNFYL